MKSIQKWITEQTSDVDETSSLAQPSVTMFDFLELNCLLLMVSINIGERPLICLQELCTRSNLYKSTKALLSESA